MDGCPRDSLRAYHDGADGPETVRRRPSHGLLAAFKDTWVRDDFETASGIAFCEKK
jgi:hypothetical protein